MIQDSRVLRLEPIPDVVDDGFRLEILIVGSGYCGTRYAARLLSSVGLPCGHEWYFGSNGYRTQAHFAAMSNGAIPDSGGVDSSRGVAEASCWAVRHIDHSVVRHALLVHLTRDPIKILRYHARDHANVDYAANWLVDTNAIVEKHSDERRYHRIRVEDCPGALLELVGKGDATDYFDPSKIADPVERARAYNSKWHRKALRGETAITWADLVWTPAVRRLWVMGNRYGYNRPDGHRRPERARNDDHCRAEPAAPGDPVRLDVTSPEDLRGTEERVPCPDREP